MLHKSLKQVRDASDLNLFYDKIKKRRYKRKRLKKNGPWRYVYMCENGRREYRGR